MQCQVPGCKNKAVILHSKNEISLGVYVENVTLWTCRQHPAEEIGKILQDNCEQKARNLQILPNPFEAAEKLCKFA